MGVWGMALALSMRSSWRAGRGAGPSPGVLCFEYRFDEGLTPRANGWPASSGRRAVAVLSPSPISLRRVGGPCEEPSRVRPSIPLDPPMTSGDIVSAEELHPRSRSIRSRRRKVAGLTSPPSDETGRDYRGRGNPGGEVGARNWQGIGIVTAGPASL